MSENKGLTVQLRVTCPHCGTRQKNWQLVRQQNYNRRFVECDQENYANACGEIFAIFFDLIPSVTVSKLDFERQVNHDRLQQA